MSKHRITDFARYESLARFKRSVLDDIKERSLPRSARDTTFVLPTLAEDGWRCCVSLPEVVSPASGTEVIVIDDTRDYRDRLVMVEGPWTSSTLSSTTSAMYPGSENDAQLSSGLVAEFANAPYYTGEGYATPTVAASDETLRLVRAIAGANDYFRLYARDTDGALCVAAITGSSVARFSFFLMITVSGRTGFATNGTTIEVPGFGGGDWTAALPHDLNNLQDLWHMNQTPPSNGTFALGKITEGTPPNALEHTVRGETFRQPLMTPALTRAFFVHAATDTVTLIDDRQDWRDRVITVTATAGAADIRPGQVADDDNGSEDVYGVVQAAGYTGPGDNDDNDGGYGVTLQVAASNDLRFYADPDTGHLYLTTRDTTNSYYINGWIEASPQTGLRSQTTAETALAHPADAVPPAGRLVDELADLGTEGIFARLRADRGIVNVGGLVAAVGDQSGNGHHVVEPRVPNRPGLPEPVELAKGNFGLVHSAVDENDEDGRLLFGFNTEQPDWTKENEDPSDFFGSRFTGAHIFFVGDINTDTIPLFLYNFNGSERYRIYAQYTAGTFSFYFGDTTGTLWQFDATPPSYSLGEPFAMGVDISFEEGLGWVPSMAVRTLDDGLTVATQIVEGTGVFEIGHAWDLILSSYMNGHTFEFAWWRESLGSPDVAISTAYSSNRYGL